MTDLHQWNLIGVNKTVTMTSSHIFKTLLVCSVSVCIAATCSDGNIQLHQPGWVFQAIFVNIELIIVVLKKIDILTACLVISVCENLFYYCRLWPQHMHTNKSVQIWTWSLGHRSCKSIMKEKKHPCCSDLCSVLSDA